MEYAKLHNLKTKDIYQWRTSLIKKGFLPMADDRASVDFIPVQPVEAVAAVNTVEDIERLLPFNLYPAEIHAA